MHPAHQKVMQSRKTCSIDKKYIVVDHIDQLFIKSMNCQINDIVI